MTDNMRIWNALAKTDPKHTKPFKRAGGFSGTAVKPIWQTHLLTEKFGPAGLGWGMMEPKFETVVANDEILVFCTVALWYIEAADKRGLVYGVGGDKVQGKNKYGPYTNDEAFKASYTDALSNAMKQIGVAADIHMGLFDDEKYVREVAREFEDKPEMSQEPDVALGSARWVEDQKRALTLMATSEAVQGWVKTNTKNLNKLYRDNEPLWTSLKQAKDEALDRVRAPV